LIYTNSIMENLANATEIYTEGLMRGNWSRVENQKSPIQIFQSKSHANFVLQFTKAWMVEIKYNEKDEVKSFAYFCEPKHGYVTERGPSHDDKKLSIKIIDTEANESDAVESIAQLRLENDHYRAKINDLLQQVKSLQVICYAQERSLRTLSGKFVEEMTSVEGNNQKNEKVPFSPVSIHNTHPQLRPQRQVAKDEHYDYAKEMPLPRPYGPETHEPYRPISVPMTHGYGSPPFGVSIPFGGYDPCDHPNMHPHHPTYDHPIQHPYWFDYPSYMKYRHHHYSSMSASGLEPRVMHPTKTVDGPYGAPAHWQSSMSGENIYSAEKQSYQDERKQNLSDYHEEVKIEQSPKKKE